MKDCRPGRSRGIRNAFDYDPTHTLGSPHPTFPGDGSETPSSTKRLFEMDGAEAVAADQRWPPASLILDTGLLKFLAVGGKTNKATDTLGKYKKI